MHCPYSSNRDVDIRNILRVESEVRETFRCAQNERCVVVVLLCVVLCCVVRVVRVVLFTSVVLFVLLHADGITVGALYDIRCGWGSNGEVEVGQESIRGVPTNMQRMARCP
jgi:hypothetical protein